jgi:CRISPR/Cas system-associated exonuclease Cas4 (RecB family)
MIVVFLDDFAMIEGDAKVKTKNGEAQSIEYVSTRRDMIGNRMMEAAVYLVSEPLLHELGTAKGKIRFYLAGSDSKKDVEVEVAASNFEDIDAYISETKTVLEDLFKSG